MKSKFIEEASLLVKKGDNFLKNEGPKSFGTYARELLQNGTLAQSYEFKELVSYSFHKKFTSHQNFKFLEFSDLPITIARGDRCFIDVYFWRRRPTTIHNHHFAGAFQCLEGNNEDLEFKFKSNRRLGKFHALGELIINDTRTLRPGDVVQIDLLDKFIHQNHHHSDLTVNLCFRTSDVSKKNLSNYTFSGLRFEKDSELISRVNRLIKFASIGDFNLKSIDLSLDDAMAFVIETYGTQNRYLLELQAMFLKTIKKEFKIDLIKILKSHDLKMNEIENSYE